MSCASEMRLDLLGRLILLLSGFFLRPQSLAEHLVGLPILLLAVPVYVKD